MNNKVFMNRAENNLKEWLLPKLTARGMSVEELARKVGLNRAAQMKTLTGWREGLGLSFELPPVASYLITE